MGFFERFMTQTKLHIEIQKADGMQGFAAFEVSPARSDKKVVLLNVYATLLSSVEEKVSAKELMLEHLMHEFGHIMQEWLDLEFSEEVVEKFVQSYAEKYHVMSYNDTHGDQEI